MMSHIPQDTFESFWISVSLIFAALVYLRGWLRLRRHESDRIAGGRAGSFVLGLSFIWIATASPLAELDHHMLTAHMIQHFLLMTLAPPLILLGVPVKPWVYGLSQPWVRPISRTLRSAVMRQLGNALTHPAFCWLAGAGTLVVWHIPGVFAFGFRSHAWHGVEQVSFFAAGLLFWWPVVRPSPGNSKWPESAIILYLFLATLPCDILSGFLVFCDRVVYPVFLSSTRSFGMSALEDQQCAGALMWTGVTVVYLIAGTVFTARLLSPHRSDAQAILRLESQIAVRPADRQGMEAV
jgi:putative membrane protein